jgi:hypothetical protein
MEPIMQRNPIALLTTHQETPWTITQLRVVSVHNDDNHELIQLFDEVISIQQPWRLATPSCNLPKTCGSRGKKGGMTLYHIRYVEIGSILVLLGN